VVEIIVDSVVYLAATDVTTDVTMIAVPILSFGLFSFSASVEMAFSRKCA